MDGKRELSDSEVTLLLADLRDEGVKVFDFRGKPAKEQQEMMIQLKAVISEKLIEKDLPPDQDISMILGSGKTEDPAVLDEAEKTGNALKACATGGSKHSVMGAVSRGAELAIGVTCNGIINFEVPDSNYDILVIADGDELDIALKNRLDIERQITHKELALEGGLGTLEEILDSISLGRNVALQMPYFESLLELFISLRDSGLIDDKTLNLVLPVSPSGTDITPLSEQYPRKSVAINNDSSISTLVEKSLEALNDRGYKSVHVLDGTKEINSFLLTKHDAFLLPPGDLDAVLKAVSVMVAKRISAINARKNGAEDMLADIPIVIVHKGIYDGLVATFEQMHAGSYLYPGEEVADLLKNARVTPNDTAKTVIEEVVPAKKPGSSKSVITDAIPSRESDVREKN